MYRHTQVGWVILGICGALILATAGLSLLLAREGVGSLAFLPPLVPVVVLLLTPTLTVTVDEEEVRVRFGAGLVGRRFRLEEIAGCDAVRNPWWWGWGIKLMWAREGATGWMYNVSGLEAVELRMTDGRRYRIGTDEPQALAQAIRERLQR